MQNEAPSSPIPLPAASSSSRQQEEKAEDNDGAGVIVDDDDDDDVDMVTEDDDTTEGGAGSSSCASSPRVNRHTFRNNLTSVLPSSPTSFEDGVYPDYVVSDEDENAAVLDYAIELDQYEEIDHASNNRPRNETGTSGRKIMSGTMSPRQLKCLTMMEDLAEGYNEDDNDDTNTSTEVNNKLPVVAKTSAAHGGGEDEIPMVPSLNNNYYSTLKTAPRTMVAAAAAAAAAASVASSAVAASLSPAPAATGAGRGESATSPPPPFLTKLTCPHTAATMSPPPGLSSATSPRSHNRQLKQIHAMVSSSNMMMISNEDNNNTGTSSAVTTTPTSTVAASGSGTTSKSDKKSGGRPLLRYMDIRKWGGSSSSSSNASRVNSSSTKQPPRAAEDFHQLQPATSAGAAAAATTTTSTTATAMDDTVNLPTEGPGLLMADTNSATNNSAQHHHHHHHARNRSMESASSVEQGGDSSSVGVLSGTSGAVGGGGGVAGSALTSSVMTSWDEDYLEEDVVVNDDDDDDDDGDSSSSSESDSTVDEEDGEVDEEEEEEEEELFGGTQHHDDDYYDDVYDSPDDDTTDFCYLNNAKPIDWNSMSAYPLPAHWLEEGAADNNAVGVVLDDSFALLGGSMPNMGYSHRRRSSAASTGSGDGTGGGQQQRTPTSRSRTRSRTPAIFTQDDADETVWEQCLLLQAVWELLAERDEIGVEGSMDQSDNIWKKGPLKKLSTLTTAKISVNMWKVKYVELRRGNLCYYEDSGQTSGRKIIHLRHNDTIVQACDRSSNNSSTGSSGNSSINNTSIDKTNSTDNDVKTSSIPLTTLSRSGSQGGAASISHAATSGGAGDVSSNTNANNANTNMTGGGNAAKDSTLAASSGAGGNEQRSGDGKSSSGGGGGGRNSKLFCFEIIQPGSPKHVWMARSEEERQSWLQAIRGAMIGSLEGDVDHADDDGKKRRKRQLDLVTHKKALDLYSRLRHDLQKTSITSPQHYCNIVFKAVRQLTVNTVSIDPDVMDDCNLHEDALLIPTLRIPVQWVRDQLVHAQQTTSSSSSGATSAATLASKAGSTHTTTTATSTAATAAAGRATGKATAPHKKLKILVADFWKSMGETTFGVNGMVIPKESPFASERTVGALCRCILEFDKAFNEDGEYDINQSGLISELQAVAYARNILMTVLKSKQQQDVVCTINDLLQNDQVILEAEPSEDTGIVHLEISFAGDDLPDDQTDTENEISLWFRIRRKNSATSMWKRRFAVLSGVVLSYYEAATPRPHGLRGQLVLSGATVQQDESFLTADASKDDKYVLLLATAAEERWLSFESEDDMKKWQSAIQEGIDSCDAAPSLPSAEGGGKNKGKSILKLTESALKAAIPDSGIRVGARVVRGATGSGVRVIRSAKDGSMKVFRTAVGMLRHIPSSAASAAAMATGTAATTKSSISRRPSMQMLMSNAAPLGGGGIGGNKREPTVQCVAEQTYSFAVYEAPAKLAQPPPSPSSDATTDPNLFREWKRETPPANPSTSSQSSSTPRRLFTVNAKLFQAFLLTGGGKSGRLSRGDALIEMEFFFTTSCVGISEEEVLIPTTGSTPVAAAKKVANIAAATAATEKEEQQQRARMDFDDEYGFGGPITI